MKFVRFTPALLPLALACARGPALAPSATVQGWRCSGPRATLHCETVELGGQFRVGCGGDRLPPAFAGIFDRHHADLWFAPDGSRPPRRYRFAHHGRLAPAALQPLINPPAQAGVSAASVAPFSSRRGFDGSLWISLGAAGEWRCLKEGPPEQTVVPAAPPWRDSPVTGGLRELREREGKS